MGKAHSSHPALQGGCTWLSKQLEVPVSGYHKSQLWLEVLEPLAVSRFWCGTSGTPATPADAGKGPLVLPVRTLLGAAI
jgi:hypothetical protein